MFFHMNKNKSIFCPKWSGKCGCRTQVGNPTSRPWNDRVLLRCLIKFHMLLAMICINQHDSQHIKNCICGLFGPILILPKQNFQYLRSSYLLFCFSVGALGRTTYDLGLVFRLWSRVQFVSELLGDFRAKIQVRALAV